VLAASSRNFRRNDIRTASQPCHGESAYESQHGASCDVDRGRGDYAGSLDHCGGSQWRKPRQDGDAQIVGKRDSLNRTLVGNKVAMMLGQMPLEIEKTSPRAPSKRTRFSLPPVISDQIGITVTINIAVPTRRMM
jgi:hypothetical protein